MSNKPAMGVVLVALTLTLLVWLLAKRPSSTSAWMMDTIRFDTSAWQLQEASATTMTWTNPEGDVLSLSRYDGEPVTAAEDLSSLRLRARQLAESNRGGLVHADFIDRDDVRAASIIFKQERLPAYAYTGMLIIPRRGHHFVVTVESVERGMTGVRDALVTAQLLQQGQLDPTKRDANRRVEGWFSDPYDSAFNATALNSVADSEQYDALVPSHPLSKVRTTLRTIEKSLALASRPE